MDEILDALIELLESGEEISDVALDEIIAFLEDEENVPEELPPQPVPPGADLLWVLSGANPEAWTQYLRSFPDPALNALARNPAQLQRVMERLQSQVTLPSGESEDNIAKAGLNSSNIYGFRYDPRHNHLLVRFNSGSVYEYEGVPPQIFKIFQAGAVRARTNGRNQWGQWWKGKIPSLGAAFYNLIRQGNYPYQRLH